MQAIAASMDAMATTGTADAAVAGAGAPGRGRDKGMAGEAPDFGIALIAKMQANSLAAAGQAAAKQAGSIHRASGGVGQGEPSSLPEKPPKKKPDEAASASGPVGATPGASPNASPVVNTSAALEAANHGAWPRIAAGWNISATGPPAPIPAPEPARSKSSVVVAGLEEQSGGLVANGRSSLPAQATEGSAIGLAGTHVQNASMANGAVAILGSGTKMAAADGSFSGVTPSGRAVTDDQAAAGLAAPGTGSSLSPMSVPAPGLTNGNAPAARPIGNLQTSDSTGGTADADGPVPSQTSTAAAVSPLAASTANGGKPGVSAERGALDALAGNGTSAHRLNSAQPDGEAVASSLPGPIANSSYPVAGQAHSSPSAAASSPLAVAVAAKSAGKSPAAAGLAAGIAGFASPGGLAAAGGEPHGVNAIATAETPGGGSSGLARSRTGDPAALVSPGDSFRQIDTGGASPQLLRAGPSVVEVGVNDPAHGWIEVRAQSAAGQVHASVSAASPEAQSALGAQLPGMAGYLSEREIGVRTLAVGHSAEGTGDALANSNGHTPGGNGREFGGNAEPSGSGGGGGQGSPSADGGGAHLSSAERVRSGNAADEGLAAPPLARSGVARAGVGAMDRAHAINLLA